MKHLAFVLAAVLFLCFSPFGCLDERRDIEDDSSEMESAGISDPDGDFDDRSDDDDSGAGDDDDDGMEKLLKMFEEMGFFPYLEFQYTRTEPGFNNYTNYFYSKEDCRCSNGREAHVSVSHGTVNKVMIFLEGGGASWPGGGFAVPLDAPGDATFRSRDPNNPLCDWHFVYVPHCDDSIHSGDNSIEYGGYVHHHWGLRHTAAAVALVKELFPNPDKILISGASAGGFGTFVGWAVAKAMFMNTDTYIFNDSGVGFWNPDELETWDIIREAWNLRIPDDCEKCVGTVQTWMYEVYLDYDPQVRIGMFSSYRDWIISLGFLGMDQDHFETLLMDVTDQIRKKHPDRFARFFIKGDSHSSYEFLLPEGPYYSIRGTTMYEWIDQLVNGYPSWTDMLE